MGFTGLDQNADIKTLRRLHEENLLSREGFLAACALARPASAWFAWARRMLLFWGAALVLAGIIFFFAYNWAAMGKFLKLGLVEAGIAGCALAAWWRGRTMLSGKVLMLCASVLTGVLLAVYGQIYQTGADAFELFFGWAVLITGWVLISGFAALWLVWLLLLNISAVLYWDQAFGPLHPIAFEYLCLALACLNGLALALCRAGVRRGLAWLYAGWVWGVLLFGVLAPLTIPALGLIFDAESAGWPGLIVSFVWLCTIWGGYYWFRFRLRDITSLALVVADGCIVFLSLAGKILVHNGTAISVLLFAIIVLAVASGALIRLRKIAQAIKDEAGVAK